MSRRIEDIEVLRGEAVLAVVVHHSIGNLFTWTTPGLARFSAYFIGALECICLAIWLRGTCPQTKSLANCK